MAIFTGVMSSGSGSTWGTVMLMPPGMHRLHDVAHCLGAVTHLCGLVQENMSFLSICQCSRTPDVSSIAGLILSAPSNLERSPPLLALQSNGSDYQSPRSPRTGISPRHHDSEGSEGPRRRSSRPLAIMVAVHHLFVSAVLLVFFGGMASHDAAHCNSFDFHIHD